ncbi:hypothetical protein [Arcobacter sp. YIC-80]|uniref:hypothetical protein n=1 Tax=unclassified Arcobacter TaxID=2593671 RepID=UPI0038510E5D
MSANSIDTEVIENIKLALNTKDIKVMEELKHHVSSNVRRSLARNTKLPTSIANYLAYDPSMNVSYMALQNPNCTEKRDLREYAKHPCVSCQKSEINLNCYMCKNLQDFKY